MFLSDAEQKILSPKIPKPALAPLDGDSDWKQRLTEAQNKYSNYASVHQDENRELKESYNGEKDDLGSKQELNQGLKKNFLRTDSSVARKIREPLSPRDTFVNFQDDSLKKEIKKIPFTKLPKKSGQDSHLRLSSIKDISERNKGEILEEVSPKPLGKSLDSNSRPNLNDDDDDDYDDFKIDLEETSVILDRIKRNLQAAVDTDDFDFEDSPRKTLEFDQDITKNTGQTLGSFSEHEIFGSKEENRDYKSNFLLKPFSFSSRISGKLFEALGIKSEKQSDALESSILSTSVDRNSKKLSDFGYGPLPWSEQIKEIEVKRSKKDNALSFLHDEKSDGSLVHRGDRSMNGQLENNSLITDSSVKDKIDSLMKNPIETLMKGYIPEKAIASTKNTSENELVRPLMVDKITGRFKKKNKYYRTYRALKKIVGYFKRFFKKLIPKLPKSVKDCMSNLKNFLEKSTVYFKILNNKKSSKIQTTKIEKSYFDQKRWQKTIRGFSSSFKKFRKDVI
ncbi:hypothetical protein BY996DRAFT_3195810 [Phakopsora pachyrhizi]|nr:hypothetical protein BY996DRAFT_3195810 [Phakopsora pachyrhizi]